MTTNEIANDRWLGLFSVGLSCWVVGFLYEWFRFSLWIFDLVLIPTMGLLYFGGYAAVGVALLSRGGSVRGAVVLGALAAAMVLVNPGYRVAPETWFRVHQPLFEVARLTDPGAEYYGNPLPVPLRFLTAGGHVSRVPVGERGSGGPNIVFFPQWTGVPDDAGGYLYSPDGSPAGADLYGRACAEPVELGGGWWMCEM